MLKAEKCHRSGKYEEGFTIVELLIASVIFSMVLLGASVTVIQIGRAYYKGIISSRTQESSRFIMDNISRDLQFSDSKSFKQDYSASGVPSDTWNTAAPQESAGGSPFAVCTGTSRYTYWLGTQVKDGDHGLVLDTAPAGACSVGDGSGTELLGENMRLTRFSVTRTNQSSGTYSVSIRVAYGDDDLLILDGPLGDALCRGGVGRNFCATSMLDTSVKRRIE